VEEKENLVVFMFEELYEPADKMEDNRARVLHGLSCIDGVIIPVTGTTFHPVYRSRQFVVYASFSVREV
jgi:hypothetical protein